MNRQSCSYVNDSKQVGDVISRRNASISRCRQDPEWLSSSTALSDPPVPMLHASTRQQGCLPNACKSTPSLSTKCKSTTTRLQLHQVSVSALRAYVQHKTNLKVITRMKIRSKIMSITQCSSMIRGSELVLWLADQILSLHKVLLPSQPLVNHRPLVGTKSAAWWPKQHGVRNFPKLFVLFVCLGFNGTFSTNRLYRAITVGQYIT